MEKSRDRACSFCPFLPPQKQKLVVSFCIFFCPRLLYTFSWDLCFCTSVSDNCIIYSHCDILNMMIPLIFIICSFQYLIFILLFWHVSIIHINTFKNFKAILDSWLNSVADIFAEAGRKIKAWRMNTGYIIFRFSSYVTSQKQILVSFSSIQDLL